MMNHPIVTVIILTRGENNFVSGPILFTPAVLIINFPFFPNFIHIRGENNTVRTSSQLGG